MSKHYISCARCDKDIVIKTSNDCYSSEIDGQLVCKECWQKEQPKELFNKIADLEAKLAESEDFLKSNGFKNFEEAVWALAGKFNQIFDEKHEIWIQMVNLNTKLQQENAKLKQQLAEKEADLLALDTENYSFKQQIDNLRQQLAEKEKEIETLKKCGDTDHFYGLLEDKEREIDICRKYIEKQNKDKISFAVEKLKETQIYVDNQHFMNARYKSEKKVYADIWNFIDNQIKQLKDGK